MSSTTQSPNWREILSARSTITGRQEYITSTNGILNVNATFSASAIAISDGSNSSIKATVIQSTGTPGTYGLVVLNPDGSNISGGGGGGGTQYTNGGVTPANPVGTMPVYDNAGTIASVSLTNRLPISATQSGTWILGANSGVDIGDVTINNAAGASAVNVQDGGNSITVDGSVTVSGTVAATQSGTWTVQPGNTANTTAWLVTGTGGTFPVTDSGGSITVDQPTGSNLHTVIDSGTITAVTAISNALPAGNNNIGDVDVASIAGTISTNNSSTSVLAGGAVFTGTADEITNVGSIRVSIFASHASATDGLSFQQSSNNTNWDITDAYTIPATTGKVFTINPVARYFRIVYTNGATLQTSFRLQTIYSPLATIPSSQRPADGYTNETDTEQVWSFSSLYNGTTWDRMRGDTTNGLDVDVTRLPALVAGSAIIGNVRIDQTTPGTTNGVSLAQLGANTISTGNGASGTGVLRVAQVNDGTGVLATVTNVATIGTSVTPGTAAANLGKAEDAGHTTGDTGVFILGVRNDGAATSFSGTNTDYNPIGTDAQGRVYVVQKSPTATLSNVASSATNVTILAANTGRLGAQIYNDSTQILYLKFGTTASATSFTVPLAASTYYEVPAGYTGNIDGIWASANGNARVTEET